MEISSFRKLIISNSENFRVPILKEKDWFWNLVVQTFRPRKCNPFENLRSRLPRGFESSRNVRIFLVERSTAFRYLVSPMIVANIVDLSPTKLDANYGNKWLIRSERTRPVLVINFQRNVNRRSFSVSGELVKQSYLSSMNFSGTNGNSCGKTSPWFTSSGYECAGGRFGRSVGCELLAEKYVFAETSD